MDPCPNCDTQDSDPHEPGECLLGAPAPGDDRRGWLRRTNAPAEPRWRTIQMAKVTVALKDLFGSWPPLVTTAVGRSGDFATTVEGVVTAVK